MKTNITIVSNIFNRINEDISHDPDFVSQITGRAALKRFWDEYGKLSKRIKLTAWQKEMLKEDSSCSHALNGEMTHGLIRKNGHLVWEGRCEYTDCERYASCSETAQYNRASVIVKPETYEAKKAPLTYEWLGNIEKLFQDQVVDDHLPEEVSPAMAIDDIKSFVAREEFEKISDSGRIVESDVSSRILVNAAPGSGKTHTVISRLEYIIRNQLVNDFSEVLVLVYTNAAKNEILTRLENGIFDGLLPYSARTIDICTFDSLASSYLAAIETRFAHLDYNDRIKMFNDRFLKENFCNFEYLIVDELQDLVNERAKMVLNILSAVKCGYLLLGDKCQAIYDYDCETNDKINSVEFYRRLDELLPPDILKYELLGNWRQNSDLAALAENMRCALLEFSPSEANGLIKDELGGIASADNIKQYDFRSIDKRTAILCRNNGEAEYVSHLLHEKHIGHNLLRSVDQGSTLKRFIADCLWDYQASPRIACSAFVERYFARVAPDEKSATEAFKALSTLVYNEAKETIELERLVGALAMPSTRIPDVLVNENDYLLTVSTIHKAKGREFDTVFLFSNGIKLDYDATEESRVWYVGCTRAKRRLFMIEGKRPFLQRSGTYSPRWVQTKRHRVKWTRKLKKHCANIVLGLPLDLDETGFIGEDFSTAIKRQEYIAQKVKTGDTVEVLLIDGKYQIRHNGENVVGYLSSDMVGQLLDIARETNPVSNVPPYLSPAYIKNIVTVIPSRFAENVPLYFRETKFWLGLELTGFPKINWHYASIPTENLAINQ